jgi:hypothetical protein
VAKSAVATTAGLLSAARTRSAAVPSLAGTNVSDASIVSGAPGAPPAERSIRSSTTPFSSSVRTSGVAAVAVE